MLTDLFTVLSSMPADVVAASIPPGVRRPALAASRARVEGDDVVVEFPSFVPRRPAVHLVPSFSALTSIPYSVRFEASVDAIGDYGWIATTSIGPSVG